MNIPMPEIIDSLTRLLIIAGITVVLFFFFWVSVLIVDWYIRKKESRPLSYFIGKRVDNDDDRHY